MQVTEGTGSDRKALGLRKIGASVEQQDNPQIRGMINKVKHVLSVEEI